MHNLIVDSLITQLIFGAVLLALIYHINLYFFNKDNLLFHYILYLVFTGFYLFFVGNYYEYFFGKSVQRYYFQNIGEPTQIIYLAFYFNFILQSVEVDKIKSKFLYKSWLFIMIVLIVYSFVFFFLKVFFNFYNLSIAYILIRIFIFTLTFIMLVRCYKLRELTFQKYILYGCSIFYFRDYKFDK